MDIVFQNVTASDALESKLNTELELAGKSGGRPTTVSTQPPFNYRLTNTLENDNESKISEKCTNITATVGFIMAAQSGSSLTSGDTVDKTSYSDLATQRQLSNDINMEDKKGSSEQEAPFTYYGVTIPHSATVEDEDYVGVYTDKKEALRAVKKYKGSRFKAFKSNEEAVAFSNGACDSPYVPTSRNPLTTSATAPSAGKEVESSTDLNGTASSGEKPSPFRAPKSQDSVKLRKAIECGDFETVTQTIWSNPRYLVSSGDTPAIVQEGPRYNALHVACKAKQLSMVKLLLDTIENPDFMKLLYSDDNEDTCLQRVDFLTDLYLNTPEKGLCETPLHFAVKFGAPKIVELLTSHIACDRERRNKFGQTPREIICSRCPNASSEMKAEIEHLIQERYYVPILRAEDNSSQPLVGEPWSPDSKRPLVNAFPQRAVQLPLSVKAYAGPMSPDQANEFHKKFRRGRSRSLDIRLSDTDKGLERIGREIAKEMNVRWSEHWAVLKSYCDLSKADGLSKLESYLKIKYFEFVNKDFAFGKSLDSELSDSSVCDADVSPRVGQNNSKHSSHELNAICEALGKLKLNSNSNSISSSGDGGNPFFITSPGQAVSLSPNSSGSHLLDGSVNNGSSPKTVNSSSFLEHTCQIVSNQIYTEISRFADATDEYWRPGSCLPYRLFMKAIEPIVKCLLDIVSKLNLCEEFKSSNFQTLHSCTARKVYKLIEDDDNVFARCFVEKIITISEADLLDSSTDVSDDEDDAGVGGKWDRRKQSDNRQHRSSVMQQHLRCVVHMLSQASKSKSDQSECKCSWLTYQWGDFGAGQGNMLLQSGGDHVSGTASEVPTRGGGQVSSSAQGHDRSYTNLTDASEMSMSPVRSDNSIYYTPPSSQCSSLSDVTTADEGPAVFLDGLFPTKSDLDVLRALDNVIVDLNQYPHICRWKHLVNSYPSNVIERWQSPMCAKTKRDLFNSPVTFSSTPLRPCYRASSERMRLPTGKVQQQEDAPFLRLNPGSARTRLLFDSEHK